MTTSTEKLEYRFFGWNTIGFRISLVFLSVTVAAMLLTAFVSNHYYTRAIINDFRTVSFETASRMNYQVDFYLKQLSTPVSNMISKPVVQTWLSRSEGDPEEANDFEVETEMRSFVGLNCRECAAIFITDLHSRTVSLSDIPLSADIPPYETHWRNIAVNGDKLVIPVREKNALSGEGLPMLALLQPIYNVDSGDLMGRLIMDLNFTGMDDIFKNSHPGSEGEFFIVSSDRSIVYHPQKDLLGQPLESTRYASLSIDESRAGLETWNGEKMLVASSKMNSNKNWSIVTVIPFSAMASGLESAKRTIAYISGSICLLTVLMIIWLSRRMVRPIRRLVTHLEQLEGGNLHVRVEVTGKDEIQFLNHRFNRMMRRLQDLIQRISEFELREVHLRLWQKEAQIQALQNQINPHFLYNTLDIIKSMAYLEKHDLVVSMTHHLADFYRYNALISDQEVTLGEELNHLNKYLAIIRVRYPSGFASEVIVNDKYRKCRMIRLTLQPIVENAVKFAIEPANGIGRICINAYEESGDLLLEISDTGQGFDSAKLEQIRHQLSTVNNIPAERVHSSVGLINVHSRIRLKYGRDYGVAIYSFNGRGTIVTLRIPYRGGEEKPEF